MTSANNPVSTARAALHALMHSVPCVPSMSPMPSMPFISCMPPLSAAYWGRRQGLPSQCGMKLKIARPVMELYD